MQWAECVCGVQAFQPDLESSDRYLQLRYEDFLQQRDEEYKRILAFLDLALPAGLLEKLPLVHKGNFGKWKAKLSREELAAISPVIEPLNTSLGYE